MTTNNMNADDNKLPEMDRRYKLIIFDLDGTLSDRDATVWYDDARQWMIDNPFQNWAIATNQGGIGMRYWMEKDGFGNPQDYPTLERFLFRIKRLFGEEDELSEYLLQKHVFVSMRYQSKKGNWSPIPDGEEEYLQWSQNWRKPNPGMLISASLIWNVHDPKDILMIGDSEEDEEASINFGCDFRWAWDFFGREKPVEEAL